MLSRINSLHKLLVAAVAALSLAVTTAPVEAAGITYQDGDKYVKFGGRIQLQYHQVEPDGGESTDEVFFRRLRPYIEGSVHKDWKGKFQWDMGKAEDGNEISIKDAYLQYKGLDFMTITLGNANFPFSRELLTSSKYQQLVERTFVGDHDYGTPDRNAGLHLAGFAADKKFEWHASLAASDIDPDNRKLDFDTPVNRNADFNQGWMVGGRLEYHPFGLLKKSQGDFKKDLKATIGIAAFTWSNDDDNNTFTDAAGVTTSTSKFDIDSVTGFEVSAAFRARGVSIDAEYNLFDAETTDTNATGGLFVNGETELTSYAIEGGYLFGKLFEVVAGYESQDADGYAEEWTRTSLGANYFFTGNHDIKLQATYRIGKHLNGVDGADADEVFLQAQYVF